MQNFKEIIRHKTKEDSNTESRESDTSSNQNRKQDRDGASKEDGTNNGQGPSEINKVITGNPQDNSQPYCLRNHILKTENGKSLDESASGNHHYNKVSSDYPSSPDENRNNTECGMSNSNENAGDDEGQVSSSIHRAPLNSKENGNLKGDGQDTQHVKSCNLT